MPVLRSVWRVLVGIKDALVLLFMVLLFAALWAALSTRAPTVRVPDGAALHIPLSGVLVDQRTERDPFALLSGQRLVPETEVAEMVRLIDLAAEDSRISMITLDLDGFLGGGLANLDSVGAALARFRATGKPVEAWASAYTDPGYYLAAHADRILLSPMGAVILTGPGGSGLYFARALDRLRVNVEVFRVGEYKSFVEPFILDRASPEARADEQQLANDLWAVWQAGIRRQRPALDIGTIVATWPQRIAGANRTQAELARDAGLVDDITLLSDWQKSLRDRLGEGRRAELPGDFLNVSYDEYRAARRPLRERGDAVAVVHVSGTIIDGAGTPGMAGGDTIADLIGEAIADDRVKAIVVRVNSPGGSATASERIRVAMEDARLKDKPVVASFGPVAASGGYWVGMGADHVLAHPATITGSIGVFGILPTFERSLAEIGITTDGVVTTPYSGQPDLAGGLNQPTRDFIQATVGDVYRQFVGLVADSRGLPLPEVERVAEGRIWAGTRAQRLRLIDGFGDLDAAIAEAGRRAGLGDKPAVKVMRPARPFFLQLLNDFGSGTPAMPADALRRAVTASRLSALAQVEAAAMVANGPTIQATCTLCAAHDLPRAPMLADAAVRPSGLVQRLLATLVGRQPQM